MHHADHAVDGDKHQAALALYTQNSSVRVHDGNQAHKDIPLTAALGQVGVNHRFVLDVVRQKEHIVLHHFKLRPLGGQRLLCQIFVAQRCSYPAGAVAHTVEHLHTRHLMADEHGAPGSGFGKTQRQTRSRQGGCARECLKLRVIKPAPR